MAPKINQSDPLFIGASENSSAVLVSIKLIGLENYSLWSRSMRISLLGKRKFGFVTSACSKESYREELYEQWKTCNRALLAFGFGNARHGQGPGSGRDKILSSIPNLKILIVQHDDLPKQSWVNSPIDMSSLTKIEALKCEDISTLVKLPNLEELKLKDRAAIGYVWRLRDDDIFESLKLLLFLKVHFTNWVASSDNFPSLKHLVLKKCDNLKEIPIDFGEICTLESIELHNCSPSAEDSARKIEQEQEDMESIHHLFFKCPGQHGVSYWFGKGHLEVVWSGRQNLIRLCKGAEVYVSIVLLRNITGDKCNVEVFKGLGFNLSVKGYNQDSNGTWYVVLCVGAIGITALLDGKCKYPANFLPKLITFEPSPMHDFCVADASSTAKVNGLACKDPESVGAEDFFFSGLYLSGNTSNTFGSKVTAVNGDVFVFPIGLVHYQRNVGYGNAVAIAALSSQNPGVINIDNAVFGSEPAIETDILSKDFQVDESNQALVSWRARDYTWRGRFEPTIDQTQVWKIAWRIEDLRTLGFGPPLLVHGFGSLY
ncbi:putative germin-like protein 2-3 [Capsicum annuum]|nr:putative germin-like protein 2-3 [Capsicum annuum]